MITQYLIRSGNLRQIYQLIDQNIGISRARLAKITKLSKTTVSSLVDELIAGGYTADTPAAIVYKATWPEEKTFVCTVGTLAETAKKNQITKTALMIIGNAVSQGNYRRSDLYNPAFTTEFREAEK